MSDLPEDKMLSLYPLLTIRLKLWLVGLTQTLTWSSKGFNKCMLFTHAGLGLSFRCVSLRPANVGVELQ
ncbi:hypothetical protein Nstercoris_01921 [Nitrosomonas stercoris]|uniref:Uncharacterized protein n=1 Tax=Nitrosomonas stercoris TaxID=1444684 RepID=A0A4Y1YRM0_9PROT|nr:hypothetical protein Nstercoris_01921 [Nitrosomonas stercoris]